MRAGPASPSAATLHYSGDESHGPNAIFTPPDRIRRNLSKENQNQTASVPKTSNPGKVKKRVSKRKKSGGQPSQKSTTQPAAAELTADQQAPPGDAPPPDQSNTATQRPPAEQPDPTPSQAGTEAGHAGPVKLTAAKSLAAPKIKADHAAGASASACPVKQEQLEPHGHLAVNEPTSAVRERHVATAAAENLRRPSTQQQLGTPGGDHDMLSPSTQQAPTPTPSAPPQHNGPNSTPPPTQPPQANATTEPSQTNPPSVPGQANPPIQPSQTSPAANPPLTPCQLQILANQQQGRPLGENMPGAQMPGAQMPGAQMSPSGGTVSRRRRQKTIQEKANHARFMRFTRHIKSPSVAFKIKPPSTCARKKLLGSQTCLEGTCT